MVRTWSSSGGGAGPRSPAEKASATPSSDANDDEWNLGGPDCALNEATPGAACGGLSKSIGYMKKVEGNKLVLGNGTHQPLYISDNYCRLDNHHRNWTRNGAFVVLECIDEQKCKNACHLKRPYNLFMIELHYFCKWRENLARLAERWRYKNMAYLHSYYNKKKM